MLQVDISTLGSTLDFCCGLLGGLSCMSLLHRGYRPIHMVQVWSSDLGQLVQVS